LSESFDMGNFVMVVLSRLWEVLQLMADAQDDAAKWRAERGLNRHSGAGLGTGPSPATGVCETCGRGRETLYDGECYWCRFGAA